MTNPQATITIGVDGATQARRDIDSVGGALRGMNDTSLRSLSGQIGSVSSGMGALKATVGAALGALAGAITVGAFAGWIKGAIDATDAADDLSQKTGIAVDDLAGLELAFQKGGMEAGELDDSERCQENTRQHERGFDCCLTARTLALRAGFRLPHPTPPPSVPTPTAAELSSKAASRVNPYRAPSIPRCRVCASTMRRRAA